jgi:hypothetical protein
MAAEGKNLEPFTVDELIEQIEILLEELAVSVPFTSLEQYQFETNLESIHERARRDLPPQTEKIIN